MHFFTAVLAEPETVNIIIVTKYSQWTISQLDKLLNSKAILAQLERAYAGKKRYHIVVTLFRS